MHGKVKFEFFFLLSVQCLEDDNEYLCWYVDFSCLLICLNEIINLAERKRAHMRGNNQIVVDKTGIILADYWLLKREVLMEMQMLTDCWCGFGIIFSGLKGRPLPSIFFSPRCIST